MSKQAYDRLMEARQRQFNAFDKWLKDNSLHLDADAYIVDREGNKYDTPDDYRAGKLSDSLS
jgi:hypothetical protein